MTLSASPSARNTENRKRALLIATGRFAGLRRTPGRLKLAWFTLSSVPSDIQDELVLTLQRNRDLAAEMSRLTEVQARDLNRVTLENEHLKAELAAAENNQRQLQLLAQENEDLKVKLKRADGESDQKLAVLRDENRELKEQNSRGTREWEEKLAAALTEIERLKALMERVSAGVR